MRSLLRGLLASLFTVALAVSAASATPFIFRGSFDSSNGGYVTVGPCGAGAIPSGQICTTSTTPSNNCSIGAVALNTSNGNIFVCTAANTWTETLMNDPPVTVIAPTSTPSGAPAGAVDVRPVINLTPFPVGTPPPVVFPYATTSPNTLNANVNTPAPCATPTCATLVFPGVTPWPVTTAPPFVPANPLPVTTPAPCTSGTCTSTVVQPTGTNLHAVLDTTSTTAVTQATGTNLHAVLDSGTTTVTQATGTNLHAVIDSGVVSPAATIAPQTVTATPSPTAAPTLLPVEGFNQAQGSTGWLPLIFGDQSVVISDASSGETQLVALASGKKIYVTGLSFQSAGIVNVNFALATGASCASPTAMTGAYPEVANSGISLPVSFVPYFIIPAGDALCINLSASVGVYGLLTFAQM